MALGINTNVASINAQNQLSKSQGQNDQALERLSSGLRINSAADDAAGLAISTRFESQISGQQVASRNAQDGISLAQTAEGALDEITNNLSRMRELSVQSANATNSASDRQALNDEVQQRIEEIDRIASQTDFNGLNVLDGSLDSQDFQVGANRGQTIGVDLSQGSRADQIGDIADVDLDVDFGELGSEFNITVGDNETTISTDEAADGGSAATIAESIRAESIEGVSFVEADNTQELGFDEVTLTAGEGSEATFTFSAGDAEETISFESPADGDDDDLVVTAQDLADAVNANSNLSAEDFSATVNDEGNLEFSQPDGENFNIDQTVGGAGDGLQIDDNDDGTFNAALNDQDFSGSVNVVATETVVIGDEAANSADVVGGEATFNTEGGIEDIDISTVDGANESINRVDAALDTINGVRSELGAVQNRFDSTIANLDNSIENLSGANSRIRDADFAAESANLSQSQVLQQAGISVLAQANARPQQVLSLLQ